MDALEAVLTLAADRDVDAIREGLLDEGRLTPTHLDLRDREYDTKTVREAAASLAADVEAYLKTADAWDISELEHRRFAATADRATLGRPPGPHRRVRTAGYRPLAALVRRVDAVAPGPHRRRAPRPRRGARGPRRCHRPERGHLPQGIDVFDAIRAEEERKVATLFDPDGPASTALSRLTDDRDTAVDYDLASEGLEVHTADGRTFAPHRLSRGTRDQLYFAPRVALAGQLLDGGPGFLLLLDDPFLAADPDRLGNGFEPLQGLADDGWQIRYYTAKPEVYDGMAEAFDCPVHHLPVLEH